MKKSGIFSALDTLPEDDITIDDVVEKLYLVKDLQNRIDSIKEGKTATPEEAKAIFKDRLGNLWQD